MSSPQNPLQRPLPASGGTALGPSAGSPVGLACLACPACHQPALQRRHRHALDRVLALFMPPTPPLRRYACTANGCGWQGLLRGHTSRRPGYLPQQWL